MEMEVFINVFGSRGPFVFVSLELLYEKDYY